MAQIDDIQTYVNLELPRRSVFLTKAITGYDGDPNGGGAPAIVALSPLGTWFREETAGQWWRKAEGGWENQTGAGDVVGPATVTADGNVALYDGTTGKLIKDGPAIGDLATTTALSNHVTDTANPHATSIANLGSGTFAQLTAAVSDATLVDDTHVHDAADVTTGTFADARIAQSNVTNHEAAIDHNNLTNYAAGEHRVINDVSVAATDLWSAQKINSEVQAITSGYARRAACIDLVDNTLVPPTEVSGDRYVLDFTVGSVNAAWDGAAKGDIVEFDGALWVATTPAEGWITYLDSQNQDALYVDDGTPAWEVRPTIVTDHANLSNIGTNTHAQIDTHISDTANPHATSIANIGSGTIAQLNTAISDATLVQKVGVPVDNTLGVWLGDGLLEHDPNLFWNSSQLGIGTNTPGANTVAVIRNQDALTALDVANPNTGVASGVEVSLSADGNDLKMTAYGDSHATRADEVWLRTDQADVAMILGTNDTDRMHIAADGKVGIGRVPTTHELELEGDELIRGNDDWDGAGDQANLYLGDTNHFLRSVFSGTTALQTTNPLTLETVGAQNMTMRVDGVNALTIPAATKDVTLSNALLLGNTTDTTDGLVRHTGTDVEARVSGVWKSLTTAPAPPTSGSGWIYIEDVTPVSGTASGKTYQDAGNTVLQSVTVSDTNVDFTVRASYPVVDVDGNSAELPRDAGGGYYSGVVNAVISGTGNFVAKTITPDVTDGAEDTIAITLDPPPTITAAVFQGGYPGSQTEVKENDTFQISVTADKNFDLVEVFDYEACQFKSVGVASTMSTAVTADIADRGDSPVARPARVRVRDAVTGAFSATFDTNTAGSTDGIHTVITNNFFFGLSFGSKGYPGAQEALKNSEAGTAAFTTDYSAGGGNSIAWDSPGAELSIDTPADDTTPKTCTRIAGTYNIVTSNLRATLTRAANDAVTIVATNLAIANVAPTIDLTVPAARLRSGGLHGTSAQDHTVTITSNQEVLSTVTPSVDADSGGNRGTFQGGGFVGGPTVFTRSLRVDETTPDEKGTFAFENLSVTGKAGLVQTTINSGSAYTLGGFVQRTFNFAAFAANSTESVELVDESKLSANAFSNGNPAVPQIFGTADTSDAGKEGWFAPTAASGNVNMRMLHSPTVSANSSGLTLTQLEETV